MPEFALRLALSLAEVCDPIAVLLFGSWAKGYANVHSDLDMIVVLRERPSPQLSAALHDSVRGVPMHVDLLLWTPADVDAAQADPHGFAGSIMPSTKVLFGALPQHSAQDYSKNAERT
jgi:hypothetical protein